MGLGVYKEDGLNEFVVLNRGIHWIYIVRNKIEDLREKSRHIFPCLVKTLVLKFRKFQNLLVIQVFES